MNPKEIQQHEMFQKKRKNKNRHNRKKIKFNKKMKILKGFVKNKSFNVDIAYNADEAGNDTTVEEHSHYDYGTNKTYNEELETKKKMLKTEKWNNLKNVDPPPMTSTDFHSTDGYFCESPSK